MSLPPSSVIGAGVACLFHIARHTTASQKCALPTLCMACKSPKVSLLLFRAQKEEMVFGRRAGEGQIRNGEFCGGESGQSVDWDAGETTVRGNV
jgi:hypothetical protein